MPLRRHPFSPPIPLAACLLFFVLTFALLGISFAAPHRLVLDTQDTDVDFTLGATAHTVEGELFLNSGVLTFDPETGRASGELLFDAQRTDTGNDRRDRKMHEKVLRSDRFPQIRFVAEQILGDVSLDGESSFELSGTLELLGDEHPFTVPITAEVTAGQVTATSEFAVPYVDFGLHDPSVFVLRVEKHVDVMVRTRGSLTALEDHDSP